MKVRKYTRGCHPLFILNGIVGLESECGRLSVCDSREAEEMAQDCYHQPTRMSMKMEAERGEKNIGETNKRREEARKQRMR